METPVPIVYTKWGLANRFDDCIEMNECLKKNMKLHNAILSHELGHKKTNTFKQDMYHDLTPVNELKQSTMVLFMLKHPKTLTQFLPFYWSSRRKQIIFDLNMLIIDGLIFGTLGLFIYFV